MSNTFNYAEKFNPEVIELINQEALTTPFVVSNVDWVDAKTFHFTTMSVSGFKSDDGSGAWNTGDITQGDKSYTISHDRNVRFGVTPRQIDETNKTASIENIIKTFTRQQYVPEVDAYTFSKIVATAVAEKNGLIGASALSDFTVANVYTKLVNMMSKAKLKYYRSRGSLVCYVRSEIMDILALSTEFKPNIQADSLAEKGIETRVTKINGVPVIEVIDTDRFKSKFDFTNGFVATDDACAINVLFASVETVKVVPKLDALYVDAPSAASANKYQIAIAALYDTFVFPNSNGRKIDSVYCNLVIPAYLATATYNVGDLVTQSGEAYVNKTKITVAESFNSNKWDKVS